MGPMGAGVLHAGAAAARFTLHRYPPPDDLALFVDFGWVIRWDLRGRPPHEQQILPHPNVNLAFEASGPSVYGVDRKIFTRRLSAAGKALGIRFRPGGFRPFYARPIFSLNDRVVPAARVFGPAADEACAAVMAAAGDDGMIAAATGLLRSFGAAEDPVVEQAAGLVKRITEDPGLRRVAQLADAVGAVGAKAAARVLRLRWRLAEVGDAPSAAPRGRAQGRCGRAGVGGLGGARGRPRLRRSGPPDQGFHRDPRRHAESLRRRSGLTAAAAGQRGAQCDAQTKSGLQQVAEEFDWAGITA